MSRHRIIAGLLVAQFAGAGVAVAAPDTPPPAVSQAVARPVGAPAPAATAAVTSSYRIGPDDTLEIMVYQVPELTRTVQVDSAGQFNLPLVGRVDAAGRTADEISALLTEKLDGRYLKDPLITVLVKQAANQRVTVDGAVIKPGVYTLAGPTSLLQALALANGPDARVANLKKVAIFRTTAGERSSVIYDLTKIRDGKAPDPPVRADDIVVVDSSGTRSFFTYFANSLSLLNILRPY
jgi:polysaccharide export outer membrane protein